jgi:hypothetical protein
MKPCITILLGLIMMVSASQGFPYPLDGYKETGIRRVEAARLAVMGKMRGRQQSAGALLPEKLVDLKLLVRPELNIPEPDAEITAQVRKLLGEHRGRYGVAVLDLTDPARPLYAEHRGEHRQNVGSVGKIVVALAVFQALADIYPGDLEARKRVLRDTIITADEFIQWDHHEVRIWDPETNVLSFRQLRVGDQGSLWEFLDWMLSVSSNAAAGMVMKQAMLLVHFGKDYPASQVEADRFFKETPKKELSTLYEKTFHEPVIRNGLSLEHLRQGSFFTRYGKQQVPGTTSYGTARELMLYLLRMEQGRLVDDFSSRQIKRLLYMTERRIRYASSPALSDSAVYFKSGSLYSCKPEPGFICKKYHGNVKNYMNSIAIVETPAGENRLHYLVTLISNVLYKNSAVDHQTLATRIQRLIEAAHPPEPVAPGTVPPNLTFGKNLIGYREKHKERLLVAEIQAELSRLGYKAGKVDGKLGSKTAAAIRDFQRDHDIKVDGKAAEALLDKLKAVPGDLKPTTRPPQPDRAGAR